MIKVELIDTFFLKGEKISIHISHPQITDYRQIQIDVFEAGIENPAWILGSSETPNIVCEDVAECVIPTESLPPAIYDIRSIRLHDPIKEEALEQMAFLSPGDMDRLLFEIGDQIEQRRTTADLLAEVNKREADLEGEFLNPVDIQRRSHVNADGAAYCLFVFVRDVLVGTRMRFKDFEVIPLQSGLDCKDEVNFVNNFLREHTVSGLQFPYDESTEWESHRSNPVCVLHFPMIIASTIEDARDYCVDRTNVLLLALSLSRDAGGVPFEVVALNRDVGSAVKFSIRLPYVGNILTGQMAGENFGTVGAYLAGIDLDPMNKLLTGLYREARRDRNRDFQYLRFWQILEIMAENCNYDPASTLIDFEGQVMTESGEPRRCKGPAHIVFRLFRDNAIGTTNETWEKVNVWFAFRTSVAHHGSIARYAELARPHVKEWARRGYDEIQRSTSGHDRFLWELKEDTKLLLIKRLFATSTSGSDSGPSAH